MTRVIIDTVEKAQALVGQLVQFSWGNIVGDSVFRGVVARYLTPEQSDWGQGEVKITQASGHEVSLVVPYPNDPVYAEVFDPVHPDSLDRSPLPPISRR